MSPTRILPTPSTSAPTRRRLRALLGVALVATMLLAGCSGSDEATDDAVDTASQATAADDGAEEAAAAPAEDAADGEFGTSSSVGVREDAEQDADSPASAEDELAVDPQAPVPVDATAATGERIIKEGTVTLEVEPGQFDTAFSQVIARAQALGGHVSASSSSTDDEGLVSGQVTVRVPVRSFEDLLTTLGEAGDVVDRNITSQDVSEEYTDLESRRRNLQAQERFYLGLLEQAQSINDAIAVQQRLEGIQSQIEQITGRMNLLEDRSSFSTLTVRIREKGVDGLMAEEELEEPTGLAAYLQTARETFIGTVGTLIVAFTFALPFLVIAGLVWLVVRIVRRPSDRAEVAAGTAPVAPSPEAPAPQGGESTEEELVG